MTDIDDAGLSPGGPWSLLRVAAELAGRWKNVGGLRVRADMRGAQRRLFVAATLMATCVLSFGALLFFGTHGDLAFIAALFCSLHIAVKVRTALHARVMRRRLAPIERVLARVGGMKDEEKHYKRTLFDEIVISLTSKLKPESPLRTGARVDAWLRFDGDDWYVTVKRELTNQARLIVQGEIEDILLHAPACGGDLWIVVIVGVPDDLPPVVVGQLNALIDYTSHREAAFRSKAKRNVSIEVVAV